MRSPALRLQISASRLAELGAGLSRELLEATLDLVPSPILLIEPGTATVTYANPAADALAGGRFPRGAEAERYHELYFCTDQDGRRIPNDRMPGVLAARGERLEHFQMDWHRPDGVRALLISADTIGPTEDGPGVVVLAFEDVTAIKRAEAQARESSALLDTVFSRAPVGLAFLDRDLRYQRVNDALAEINGVSPEDHRGRTVLEVLPAQDPQVVEDLRRVLETGVPLTGVEVSGTTAAQPGVERHWLVSYYPVHRGDGDVVGLGATVTEITERVGLLRSERAARERAERLERRASFLARAGEVLVQSLDYETTLRTVASIAVPDRADWCVIDMLEADGAVRRLAVAHADPEKERLGWELTERYPPSLDEPGPLATVLSTGRPVVVRGIDEDTLREASRDDDHFRILRDIGFTDAIIVPLLVRGRTVGVVTFAYTRGGDGRDDLEVDLELAVELARRAATAIDNARLYRDRSHIARTLQRSLLPPRLPHIDGFEIAARYRAAGEGNEVGGDFYDVFQRTADSWIFVLGDVCGKGPEAAALTALARHTIRAAAIRDGAPRALLGSLHEAMTRDHERELAGERFMTAVTVCLSLSDDVPRIHLGGAGHPPPLLIHADGRAELVEPTGRALGLDGEPDIAERELDLLPGDTLVLYTDGVTDAGAPAHPLDSDEMAALAAREAGASAERIVDLLEQAALDRSAGRPRDDIALVALRRAG